MFDLDAQPKSLLTVDANPKLAKHGDGWIVAGLHLSPSTLAGVGDMCPHASPECRKLCLNYSGHGEIGLDADGLNTVQAARIRRTRYLKRDRAAFMVDLADELSKLELKAAKQGKRLAVRLNVLSDQLWERIRVGAHRNIMAMFPNVQFYDYTKIPLRHRLDRLPANYHLTFSLSENNDEQAAAALIAGINVAVPFAVRKGEPLPERYQIGKVNALVIDGDKSDQRFLDPDPLVIGNIVGLRAKGRKAKSEESSFIRSI